MKTKCIFNIIFLIFISYTSYSQNRFTGYFEFGKSFECLQNEKNNVGNFAISYGYKFDMLFVGLGSGISYMEQKDTLHYLFVPVFFRTRNVVLNTNFSPFFGLDLGILISVNNSIQPNRFFMFPNIGVEGKISKRLSMFATVGLMVCKINKSNDIYNGLDFRIGLKF